MTIIASARTRLIRKWLLSNALVPIALLTFVWFVVGDLMTHPDNLPGIDTYWHVTLIDEAMDRFQAGESIGPIAETMNAGIQYLYDTDGTYPQFVYWVSLFVGIIVGSAGEAYGFLMFAALAIALLSFYFGFRSRFGIIAALIGALAFAFAPFTLTAVAPEGRYPALLAVATIPAILAGIMSLLERPSRIVWVLTIIAVGLSVAFHAMVFYIAAIPIGFIGFLHAFSIGVGPKRFALVISAIIVGILVVWVLLPDGIADLTQRGGVASIAASSTGVGGRADAGTDSEIVPFSLRWNSFDVSLRLTNLNYAGIGIVIASLLTLVLVRRKQLFIFGLGALLAYVLTTGTLTPLWEQIPLASQLEPRRFLFPAYLGASLVIAAGCAVWIRQIRAQPSGKALLLYGLPVVVVLGLLAFDSIPMAKRIGPDARLGQEQQAGNFLGDADIDGRMFWNTGPSFAPYYLAGRKSEIEVMGRSRSVDGAIRAGFVETALAELALYNVRAVFSDEGSFRGLTDAVADIGFEEAGRWGTRVLLTSSEPGSKFMNQTRDVGLVGLAARPYWSKIFPNSVSIGNPADIPEDLLASFKVIVLSAYSITDIEDNERALLEFVNNGGIVIFEEPNKAGVNLFRAVHTSDDVPLEFSIPSVDGPVEVLPFAASGGPFRGVSYGSVGEITLAGTTPEGELVPLVQKSTTGLGAFYWVCCNIGNHIDGTSDHGMARAINNYFEEEIGGFRSIWPTIFDAEIYQVGPSTFQVSYTTTTPTPILISLSSAHKRVLKIEDGQSIDLIPFGPILTAILPAGTHTATLGTQANLVSIPITFIWLIGLTFAGVILSVGWRPFSKGQGSYTGIAAYAVKAAVGTVVRFVSPVWAGNIPIPGGVLKSDTPQVESSFEAISSVRGTLERYTPDTPGASLAVVFLEISASERQRVEFSIGDLRLHVADGSSVEPTKSEGIATEASSNFKLLSALGRPQARLEGQIVLEAGESASGFVIFDLNGSSGIRSLSIASTTSTPVEFA